MFKIFARYHTELKWNKVKTNNNVSIEKTCCLGSGAWLYNSVITLSVQPIQIRQLEWWIQRSGLRHFFCLEVIIKLNIFRDLLSVGTDNS